MPCQRGNWPSRSSASRNSFLGGTPWCGKPAIFLGWRKRTGASRRVCRCWRSLRSFLPFTEAAIARYDDLVALKLNVGKNDLRIAAITLEHGGTLVSRNLRDFQRVPGLTVEDWSV